jgi:hypothetical protein
MNFRILLNIALVCCLMSCERLLIQENTTNNPVRNFDVLWSEIDLNYSYFSYKHVDWDSLYAFYRPQINEHTTERELFKILSNLLNPLRDGHVNLYSSFEYYGYNFHDSNSPTSNCLAEKHLDKYLVEIVKPNNSIKYARIKERNIGYIQISSFSKNSSEYYYIDNILELFQDKSGIIIDVRNNGGGNDRNSKIIANRFTDKKRLYRKKRYRNGPGHDDFTNWEDDYIEPEGVLYQGKIVILINESCFSTTEDFILSFKAIPNTLIIGDSTGGGSGNPIHRELPNGWVYRFSNWQIVNPDMEYHEGIGLPPDSLIWITKTDSINGIDRILETAIKIIEYE